MMWGVRVWGVVVCTAVQGSVRAVNEVIEGAEDIILNLQGLKFEYSYITYFIPSFRRCQWFCVARANIINPLTNMRSNTGCHSAV